MNDSFRLFVPGRIEVLGKHTDYAGGASLLAATRQGFMIAVRGLTEPIVQVRSETLGEDSGFRLDEPIPPAPGHWSDYFRVTARRLGKDFPHLVRGCEIMFHSDLPSAAGLSTSSALVVAAFLALTHGVDDSPPFLPEGPRLAEYLGAVENGQPFLHEHTRRGSGHSSASSTPGVGTQGGSEDHTAILLCEPDRLGHWRFDPVRKLGEIPMPSGFTFAVAASGVRAEKTGAARRDYNRASRLAREAAVVWCEATGRDDPHLGAAVATAGAEVVRETVSTGCQTLPEGAAIHRRTEHFLLETQTVIPAAVAALRAGDLVAFGGWVDRSQRGAEELLGNQVPETIALQHTAREGGAIAASAFGAGFGGSVWALVETSRAPDFLRRWEEGYHRAFPGHRPQAAPESSGPEAGSAAQFFLTPAGGGARILPAGQADSGQVGPRGERNPKRRSE